MPSGPVMLKLAPGGATPLARAPRVSVAPTLPSERVRQGDGDELSASASVMVLLAAIGAMFSLSWRRAAR